VDDLVSHLMNRFLQHKQGMENVIAPYKVKSILFYYHVNFQPGTMTSFQDT